MGSGKKREEVIRLGGDAWSNKAEGKEEENSDDCENALPLYLAHKNDGSMVCRTYLRSIKSG